MPARSKIACDVKAALLALARLGIEARGFEHDVMLYAFLLDADPSGCPLDEQARRRLDLKLGARAGAARRSSRSRSASNSRPAIDERGLRKLYDDIELPLTRVLARMERTGIRIDPAELKRLSGADGDARSRGSPRRSTRWRASRSTSARRSSWARCCSRI